MNLQIDAPRIVEAPPGTSEFKTMIWLEGGPSSFWNEYLCGIMGFSPREQGGLLGAENRPLSTACIRIAATFGQKKFSRFPGQGRGFGGPE